MVWRDFLGRATAIMLILLLSYNPPLPPPLKPSQSRLQGTTGELDMCSLEFEKHVGLASAIGLGSQGRATERCFCFEK